MLSKCNNLYWPFTIKLIKLIAWCHFPIRESTTQNMINWMRLWKLFITEKRIMFLERSQIKSFATHLSELSLVALKAFSELNRITNIAKLFFFHSFFIQFLLRLFVCAHIYWIAFRWQGYRCGSVAYGLKERRKKT